jgi:hypothetical protein
MGPNIEILTAAALGIALSACCGFRVFVPMLAASLAGRFGWVNLPQDMTWMATLPALISFGMAAVLEIGAYYIPVVDNLLDTIATPLSVGAGTVLASSLLPIPESEPLLRWGAALVAGGGAAGTIQLGTGLLRLLSTKATGTLGNPVVATTENAAAITGTVFSFLFPVVLSLLLLTLVVWLIIRMKRQFSRVNR